MTSKDGKGSQDINVLTLIIMENFQEFRQNAVNTKYEEEEGSFRD